MAAAGDVVCAQLAEGGVVEGRLGAAAPAAGVRAAERSPLRDTAVPGVRGGGVTFAQTTKLVPRRIPLSPIVRTLNNGISRKSSACGPLTHHKSHHPLLPPLPL